MGRHRSTQSSVGWIEHGEGMCGDRGQVLEGLKVEWVFGLSLDGEKSRGKKAHFQQGFQKDPSGFLYRLTGTGLEAGKLLREL